MNTVLLIDGTNNFIRNYVNFPSTTLNGHPYGGVVGFLKSLNSFVNITKASRVIITFDGPGGSQRRRKLCSEYKNGRKPSRLNRKFEIGEDAELQNKRMQEIALRQYLEDLPVSVLCIPNIEADDVIGFLTSYYDEDRKVIASNDKDFYQLLSANTIIYKPTKKNFYTKKDCFEEFGIYPVNFALARAIAGDASDNIKGLKSIGLKTLLKKIPHFGLPEPITLDGLLQWCREQEDGKYNLFIKNRTTIANNYSIMNLVEPLISLSSMTRIKESIREHPTMNVTSFRGRAMQDGIDIGNYYTQPFLKLAITGKLNKEYV